MQGCRLFLVVVGMVLIGFLSLSCNSVNLNAGRVLTAITVTPSSADALQFSSGQVTFSATGQFSLPPLSGPVIFKSPYAGEFFVANPNNQTIANVVATGDGTVTVQCVSNVSGSVDVVASASANNGTQLVVTGQGTLICP